MPTFLNCMCCISLWLPARTEHVLFVQLIVWSQQRTLGLEFICVMKLFYPCRVQQWVSWGFTLMLTVPQLNEGWQALGRCSLNDEASYHKISWNIKVCDSMLKILYHSEIWQVPRQQCCRVTWQILEWSDIFQPIFCGIKILRNLVVRLLRE